MLQPLIVVLGPTASGKTKLAVALARHFNGEIISADSRQIFKDMDIGTGKDLNEYDGDRPVPYHLINIKEAGEKYNVDAFKQDFYQAFDQVVAKKHMPILCGGTAMYIHSILQNYQLTSVSINETLRAELIQLSKPELISRLEKFPLELRMQADYSSSKRLIRAIEIASFLQHHHLEKKVIPQFYPIVIGLQTDLIKRRKNIAERLQQRFDAGMIEEVKNLIAKGVDPDMLVFYGLEYKFISQHLVGGLEEEMMKSKLLTAIHQFAKRQMTFFRKMEKDGVHINWLDADDHFEKLMLNAINIIENKLNQVN